MAMLYEESYNGEYGQISTRSSREELLSGYGICSPCTFKSLKQFRKVCQSSSAALADGKSDELYVAFENVTSKNLEDIDKWREDSNKNLPRMRILYDRTVEILIVKFIPSCFHNTAADLFDTFFFSKLPDLLSLRGLRGTRCEGTRRSKEADCSYKPATRTSSLAWPSLVVEIGVSESLQQLRNNAWFWLTDSAGETRVVILINIDRVGQNVVIERWEDIRRTRPSRQSTPPYNPGIVQSLKLEHHVQYAGPALHIPATKVYDQPLPQGLAANDFELTTQDLENFKISYWGVLL